MVGGVVRALLSRWAAVSTAAAVLVALAAAVTALTGGSSSLVLVLLALVVVLMGVATVDRRVVAVNRRLMAADRRATAADGSAGPLEAPNPDGLTSTHPGERPTAVAGLDDLAEMTALVNLFEVLGPPGILPLPTDFSATPRTIHAMVAEVLDATKDLQILECGSGMSTVWLAAACRHAGRGSVVALEHAEQYATETRRALRRCGLQDYARVAHAPLQRLNLGERTFRWYDRSGYGGLDRVDVLFVDGPPGSIGPLARYPAFPVLVPLLSDGALIVVDDAQRSDESTIVEEWKAAATAMGGVLTITSRAGRAVLLRWHPSGGPGAPLA